MSPIVFFIIIVGVDLFLKSMKDKKKIEEARRKRSEQLKKSLPQQQASVESISLEDILKEDKRRFKEEEIDFKDYKTPGRYSSFTDYSFKYAKDIDTRSQRKDKEVKDTSHEKRNQSTDLQKDILRGIIFSEILSEPKSIKKSM